ncbi:MAG: hypothetical protein LW823_01855 [Rickettsiales bacterium]|nr:hypothetical protein [Rickettsiales bacterium]
MALPDISTTNEHGIKQVRFHLKDDRGNDPLPEALETALRKIVEVRLSPSTSNRFDSMPADLAKGELKSNQRMVDELGGRLKIEGIVNIYDEAVSGVLRANGYTPGRGAA